MYGLAIVCLSVLSSCSEEAPALCRPQVWKDPPIVFRFQSKFLHYRALAFKSLGTMERKRKSLLRGRKTVKINSIRQRNPIWRPPMSVRKMMVLISKSHMSECILREHAFVYGRMNICMSMYLPLTRLNRLIKIIW
jgi:hypothetical protein